ncbi:MAG TPA: phosphoglucosamine mutase [Terriglobia bacterium]|nr:phosphoglucosamine mutase [Terriglobia bacterium]
MLKFEKMQEKPKLFGTDGVRGVAGRPPLDRETVRKLGWALANFLTGQSQPAPLRVVLGEDTRESSAWIAESLCSGLATGGAQVFHAGVITTPGIAFLTRHHQFSAGVMVSASHNPYQDNGIKVLASAGVKLPETAELEIERLLASAPQRIEDWRDETTETARHLVDDYLDFLERLAPPRATLSRFRMVVDLANGASFQVAPAVLQRLGIEARFLNDQPNGRNINLNCGSLHPQGLASETHAFRANIGVAFDGDADRAIFSGPTGRIYDGDHVLFAMAPFLKAQNSLKGGAVVGTLMTNLGLELALRAQGIGLVRTLVGDKFVLEGMQRSGINLGGEPSGHIIFSDISLAGDGLVTMIEVLRMLAESGKSLDELAGGLRQFPQVIRNVRVTQKPPLESLPAVSTALEACRAAFEDRGRVILRYSGTEPVARVMVEGDDAARVDHHAAQIAGAIEAEVGVS